MTRVCIEKALEGDTTALWLCLERLCPAPKDRPISFPLPRATSAVEINAAVARVIEAVGEGILSPAEGNTLVALLEAQRKGIETSDLERRLAELERKQEGKHGR